MENNGGGTREGGGGNANASLTDGQLASLTPLRPVLADDEAEVWARGYGLWGDRDTTSSINGYNFNIQGVAGGFMVPVATGWTLGASLGFADSETDKDGGAGEDEAQAIQMGLRADYQNEGFFFNLGLSGALVDYDLERVVGVGGVPTAGTAETEGYTLGARAELGQAYDLGGDFTLRPMGSLAYMSATRDGYQEQGLGIFNLTVGDETAQALRAAAEISLAHDTEFASNGQTYRFTQEYRVGVTHEEALDDRQVGALGLGAPLTLQGDDDARTLVTLGAGFSFKLTENAAIFAGYDAEFGGDYRAHSINGGLRFNW
ncbi:autotransporter outer membrane beta-barrel domain-containing protein [Limibacillus halophilus]